MLFENHKVADGEHLNEDNLSRLGVIHFKSA
jgi:hypothetical protein